MGANYNSNYDLQINAKGPPLMQEKNQSQKRDGRSFGACQGRFVRYKKQHIY